MVAKITCFLAMYQYQYQFWPAWQWQYQYWPYQSILIADKPGPEGDTESQHNSGRGQDAVDDDYFPTIEELLSSTLRQRDLIKEPKKSQHTIQKGDQRSFRRSSRPIRIAQSKCVNFGDSYGN
jgi:hypothetical protein